MSEDVRMEEFELFGAEEVRAFYYSTVFTYIPSIPNRSFSDIDGGGGGGTVTGRRMGGRWKDVTASRGKSQENYVYTSPGLGSFR